MCLRLGYEFIDPWMHTRIWSCTGILFPDAAGMAIQFPANSKFRTEMNRLSFQTWGFFSHPTFGLICPQFEKLIFRAIPECDHGPWGPSSTNHHLILRLVYEWMLRQYHQNVYDPQFAFNPLLLVPNIFPFLTSCLPRRVYQPRLSLRI